MRNLLNRNPNPKLSTATLTPTSPPHHSPPLRPGYLRFSRPPGEPRRESLQWLEPEDPYALEFNAHVRRDKERPPVIPPFNTMPPPVPSDLKGSYANVYGKVRPHKLCFDGILPVTDDHDGASMTRNASSEYDPGYPSSMRGLPMIISPSFFGAPGCPGNVLKIVDEERQRAHSFGIESSKDRFTVDMQGRLSKENGGRVSKDSSGRLLEDGGRVGAQTLPSHLLWEKRRPSKIDRMGVPPLALPHPRKPSRYFHAGRHKHHPGVGSKTHRLPMISERKSFKNKSNGRNGSLDLASITSEIARKVAPHTHREGSLGLASRYRYRERETRLAPSRGGGNVFGREGFDDESDFEFPMGFDRQIPVFVDHFARVGPEYGRTEEEGDDPRGLLLPLGMRSDEESESESEYADESLPTERLSLLKQRKRVLEKERLAHNEVRAILTLTLSLTLTLTLTLT